MPMDRRYIENEHIVDRYLSGDLTVREAREFEKYCLDNPSVLNSMPIPVRLKARLARRPGQESETGVFPAIPSSTTRAALEAHDEGLDVETEEEELRYAHGGGGVNRSVVFGLGLLLLAAIAGAVYYAARAHRLESQVAQGQQGAGVPQLQAPSSVRTHHLKLSRANPKESLAVGYPTPPVLVELYIQITEGNYTQYMITMENVKDGRVMRLHQVGRDSNRELRLSFNSSAFVPGDYVLNVEGYNWRGQSEPIGSISLLMR